MSREVSTAFAPQRPPNPNIDNTPLTVEMTCPAGPRYLFIHRQPGRESLSNRKARAQLHGRHVAAHAMLSSLAPAALRAIPLSLPWSKA